MKNQFINFTQLARTSSSSSNQDSFNSPPPPQKAMKLYSRLRGKKNNPSSSSSSSSSKPPYAPPGNNSFSAYASSPSNRALNAKFFSLPSPSSPTQPSSPPPAYSPPLDDPYAFLSDFDTIFLIDDSGSMAGRSWTEVSLALKAITPICVTHDPDGIDIHFLNQPDEERFKRIKSVREVERIFEEVRPGGGTRTGARLMDILGGYVRRIEEQQRRRRMVANAANTTTTPRGDAGERRRLEELSFAGEEDEFPRPLNIIVITDGVPSDDPESVIIHAARKLDALDAPPWQVGIQFFQVGEEQGAADALKELDDGLVERGGGVRDMVDTVPWSGGRGRGLSAEGILKVVLGGVNRRLDRKDGGER